MKEKTAAPGEEDTLNMQYLYHLLPSIVSLVPPTCRQTPTPVFPPTTHSIILLIALHLLQPGSFTSTAPPHLQAGAHAPASYPTAMYSSSIAFHHHRSQCQPPPAGRRPRLCFLPTALYSTITAAKPRDACATLALEGESAIHSRPAVRSTAAVPAAQAAQIDGCGPTCATDPWIATWTFQRCLCHTGSGEKYPKSKACALHAA